jgi:hypothetical protein
VCIYIYIYYTHTHTHTSAEGTLQKHAEISKKKLDLQTNDAHALIHCQPVSRVTHSRGLDPLESAAAGANALALAGLRRQQAGGFVVERQQKPHDVMPPVSFLECREDEVLPQEGHVGWQQVNCRRPAQ